MIESDSPGLQHRVGHRNGHAAIHAGGQACQQGAFGRFQRFGTIARSGDCLSRAREGNHEFFALVAGSLTWICASHDQKPSFSVPGFFSIECSMDLLNSARLTAAALFPAISEP